MVEYITDNILTFTGLYTDEEIKCNIDFIYKRINDKRFNNESSFKNGKIRTDTLHNIIDERLRKMHLFQEDYIDTNNIKWRYIGVAPYIFYAEIKDGQHFKIHTDTGSIYDDENNIYSKMTMLTYLNDDYNGGNTVFYDINFKETNIINPQRNKTLIFDIDLFHEGKEVKGHIPKYWIGYELIFKKLI